MYIHGNFKNMMEDNREMAESERSAKEQVCYA
jgi:hypothetical protein